MRPKKVELIPTPPQERERQIEACRALGWFAKLVPGKGLVPCTPLDQDGYPIAEDLNRFIGAFEYRPETDSFEPRNAS